MCDWAVGLLDSSSSVVLASGWAAGGGAGVYLAGECSDECWFSVVAGVSECLSCYCLDG